MDADTILYDTDEKSIKAVGGTEINIALDEKSIVKDVKTKGDLVTEMTLVKTAEDVEEEEEAEALKDAKAKLQKAIKDAKTKAEEDYDVELGEAVKTFEEAVAKAEKALEKEKATKEELKEEKEALEEAVKTFEEAVAKAEKEALEEVKKNIQNFTSNVAKYKEEAVGQSVTINFKDISKIFDNTGKNGVYGVNQEGKFKVTAIFNNGSSYTNTFIKGIDKEFGSNITTTFYDDMEGKDFYSWNLDSTKGFYPSAAEVVKVKVEFEYDGEILKVELQNK